jgi:tRNA-dihydrouridine synthase
MSETIWNVPRAWVERAARLKREVGMPVGVSWNLGKPENADDVIKSGLVDLVFLGRPALANPHWPVWAARELGYGNAWGLVPEDMSWWLDNIRGDPESSGLPFAEEPAEDAPKASPRSISAWKIEKQQAAKAALTKGISGTRSPREAKA